MCYMCYISQRCLVPLVVVGPLYSAVENSLIFPISFALLPNCDCDLIVATASGRPSVSTGDSGYTAATPRVPALPALPRLRVGVGDGPRLRGLCPAGSVGLRPAEVDKEQHKAYDPSCDVRRDFDMAASVALGSGHKLLVLRFNPDAFKIAGMTRWTTKKERHAQLIRLLGELLAREPEAPFTRLFLFYDRAAENSALPCVAASPCAPCPAAHDSPPRD